MIQSIKIKMSTKATEKPAARLPSYAVMISSAIAALHARGGSSRQAIFKYVCDNYQVDPPKAALFIRKALSKGLKDLSGQTCRQEDCQEIIVLCCTNCVLFLRRMRLE